MRIGKIILNVMCLVACCVAKADVYVDATYDDLNEFWIHEESILDLGNGNKSFYLYGVNIDPSLSYDLQVTEYEVRCKSREIKGIEAVYFLKGIKKNTEKFNNTWWRTRPHTLGDGWRKLVCDKKVRDAAFHYNFNSEDELRTFSQYFLRSKQKEKQQSTTKPESSKPKNPTVQKPKAESSELDLL